MPAWYHIASPTSLGAGAAIGIIELGGDVAWALSRLGLGTIEVPRVRLREWPGVDTVVVARIAPASALVFPHGGRAVLQRAIGALAAAGVEARRDVAPMEAYPEARSLIEARMLVALGHAGSPLAIDLLMDQPRRWETAEHDSSMRLPATLGRPLHHLIDPPLVVMLGPPNIGKSTLLNALAKRSVSIVADVPGTTRDHVGVSLDLAGLVVRCIDTPGIGAAGVGSGAHGPLDEIAQQTALRIAAEADLLLLCADPTAGFVPLSGSLHEKPALRVGLRADLGLLPADRDVAVSARDGRGLENLTAAVRETLVPAVSLADPRAWMFWDRPGD